VRRGYVGVRRQFDQRTRCDVGSGRGADECARRCSSDCQAGGVASRGRGAISGRARACATWQSITG